MTFSVRYVSISKVNLIKLFLLIVLVLPLRVRAVDTCLKWFQASGVKSDNPGCLISCDMIPKDMSTFDCANRCDEFCKAKKCSPDTFWKNKLKNGAPKDWSLPTELPGTWTDLETGQIMAILNQLPDQLKDLPIEGLFRLKLSVDRVNPASTS